MTPNSEHNSRTSFTAVMKYFGMVMAMLYVAAGISILSQSNRLFVIPRHYAIPLGVCLTGYGIFRGYRLYLKYFQKESS